MNTLILSLALLAPSADSTPTPPPIPETRADIKTILEAHKKAGPRLPMPPAPTGDDPISRVNNGRFRAYYLPFLGGNGGFSREPDKAMTLDNTFKVRLFWITSRTNNCLYCLGHQEHKLAVAGLSDDDLGELDGDWSGFGEKERVAFAFTRRLAQEPQTIDAAALAELGRHYTPTQVLEIIVTVAGYASTNRWTASLNIPGEESGDFFRKTESKVDLATFLTPTSKKYATMASKVAPIGVSPRGELPTRAAVEASWKAAKDRKAVVPLADDAAVEAIGWKGAAPNWVRLLATFPKAGGSRVSGMKAAAEKGNLTPRVKALIAWSAAREDRAIYALNVARETLRALGMKDDAIFEIDADRNLTEAEALVVKFSRKLSSRPASVTDADVAGLRKHFKDAEVAEVVHHVCNAAFFDRATEAANLPVE